MIRPEYYKDRRGHDIFWKMEHGHWPYEQSLGFCLINVAKYKERAGRKTKEKALDLEKAKTYEREAIKLRDLNRVGLL